MILNFDRGYGQSAEQMVQSLMESTQMALDTMERKLKDAGINISGNQEGQASIVDIVYPVGAIYMSLNETSPSELFGGTWERIQGRFLLASGENDANDTEADENWGTSFPEGTLNAPAGEKGGEATHVLTNEQMPVHTHKQNAHHHAGLRSGSVSGTVVKGGSDYCAKGTISGLGSNSAATKVIYTVNTTATNQNTGGGAAHNNLPPYLSVYMWKRTE